MTEIIETEGIHSLNVLDVVESVDQGRFAQAWDEEGARRVFFVSVLGVMGFPVRSTIVMVLPLHRHRYAAHHGR